MRSIAGRKFKNHNMTKLCKLTKLISLLLTITLLVSCSSLKRIIPLKEISPSELEPRVTFIDKKSIVVTTSQIEKVNPELVISSYKRLLNRGDPEVRKEALHHLADLTMRLAESKLNSDSTKQSELSPALAGASFTLAIQYYQTLLSEFPEYTQRDQINYQLARAYSLNAEPESSLNVLDQIAVAPTESNSYVESQFRRGESYFVRKKFQIAEQAYTQVIKNGMNSEFYDKALYKRGWSLFKQSLYLEAQSDFFELYERINKQQDSLNGRDKFVSDLLLDTQRVISLTFYNMEGAESIQAYFVKNGHRNYEDKIYDSLAKLFITQERFQDAADTYLAYIEKNPLSLSSPEFHSQVIDIYNKGGFPSLILPAKESFVVKYGRNSLFWNKYKGTEEDGAVIEELKPLLSQHLKDISTFYHSQAQKSKKAKAYLVAAKWYREILATFNDVKIDSKYRFLLAETLSDGKNLQQAAKEYEIVAYTNQASEFSRDAGYRALVAYQEIKHPASATQSEKLTPSIVSGLRFCSAFSTDPKAPEILARVAEQQLSINDIQGAIDSSNKLLVLASTPNKNQSDRARIIIANGLFDLKRYSEAEVAITELLKYANLTNTQRNGFRQRRVESIYQLADAAKNENKTNDAIELFLKVKRLEPKSKIAINAHFDAATLLLKTEQWTKASELLESFRNSYPKNQLTRTIPEKLALVYEKQESWNKAASEYKILAQNQSDPDTAREGYWHIAQLYLKSKSNAQAISAFKHYVWTYPKPYLLAQEARNHLVHLYMEAKDDSKTYFWRQKIVSFYDKNKSENNNRTAFLAAESKYIISQPLFDEYKNIKLKLPIAKTLKKKRVAMKKALAAYNTIARYNIASFTTASTHKVARIYQILADDLMSSVRPKGLDEEELEEYGYLLEDQALPFEDKAINYFELNAKRTIDKIYDQSVKSSIDSLRKLKPAQYDKQEQVMERANVKF